MTPFRIPGKSLTILFWIWRRSWLPTLGSQEKPNYDFALSALKKYESSCSTEETILVNTWVQKIRLNAAIWEAYSQPTDILSELPSQSTDGTWFFDF